MKNSKKLLITAIAFLAMVNIAINGKAGCLSKSYQLKQKFDPKEYHPVECNCPCDYWAMRGLKTDAKSKCLECGHAHNPGPNPYVPGPNMAQHDESVREAPSPFYGVQKIIREYKERK